jgi:hypothetical protein
MSDKSAVTVKFFGICMHVDRSELDQVGPAQVSQTTEHRVILPHASDVRIKEHGLDSRGIKPHLAELRIAKDQLCHPLAQEPDWFKRLSDPYIGVAAWRLDGVTLTIEGAVGQDSGVIPSCIPRLHDYTTKLPPLLDRNREASGRASETACLFDFPRVDVRGESTPGEASVGVITVTAPAEPCLRVTHFDGVDRTFVLRLKTGAEISVWNAPEDLHCDNNADFLLYFLATHGVPEDARHPETEGWVPCAPSKPKGVTAVMAGPGCSNSAYP